MRTSSQENYSYNDMKNVTEMPRQKLLESQKTEEWQKKTIDAIIAMSDFNPGRTTHRDELRKAYNYYNGIIDDGDYTHVLAPYGKRRKNMPAKLHNYPILKPVIDLLMGEHRRRPFNFSVIVTNGDVNNRKSEERANVLRENLQQVFINELGNQGLVTGLEEEDTPPPEEVLDAFETNYRDARALRGQQSMDFLVYHQEIMRKRAKMWKHWLISGLTVTRRDIIADEVIYEVLNPLHIDFDKSEDTEFIEDGDWAAVRKLSTRANIIDTYYEHLTGAQIDQIEKPKHSSGAFLDYHESYTVDNKDSKAEVVSVYWKAQRKLGIVTFIDELGEFQEKEVSSTYVVDKEIGETVEWLWVNEVWEGTRIDEDIYIKMRVYPVQRENLDNKSICKLPINGRKYSDLNSPNISLLMLGIPYQLNYNIYKLRLETAIAKSKDIIAQLDINMIPAEWDMDKFMYYVDATGIAWADYAKEGIKLNPQHQTILDMSIKTIGDFITLLESIKAEWEELAGVSRQRQGQISQYDGRDTTQQAIVQSAMITEDLFAKFAELEQRDLQALIDLSRMAWINGKKGMYLGSDMSETLLDVDGIEHMDSEYGVFVSDAAREQEKMEVLKNLVQPFVQNGAPMSTIIDMIESTSFVALKGKIEKAERAMEELQAAQAQAEQEVAAQAQQLEVNKLDRIDINSELDRQNKVDVAIISADAKLEDASVDIDGDGIGDSAEVLAKERQHLREIEIKKSQLRLDEKLGTRKLNLDE